jgi:hypothetical protein
LIALLAALLALALAPGRASAGPFDPPNNPQSASKPLTPTNWGPEDLSVPGFQGNLSTLKSVTIKVTGFIDGSFNATNTAQVNNDISAALSAVFQATLPNGQMVTLTPTFEPVPNPQTVAPGDTISGGGTAMQMQTFVFTDDPNTPVNELAIWAMPINVSIQATGASILTDSQGNFQGGTSTSAGANLLVTFEPFPDQEIPEPATALLFGLAAGGLGGYRWFSRRKRVR